MNELRKMELVLGACVMTQKEFNLLLPDRNESIVNLLVNLLVDFSTSEMPPAYELIVKLISPQ